MRKYKYSKYALLIFFAAFILGYSLVDAFVPVREYSEMENRYLKQAPRFTLRALISNKYTMDVEEFTSDQFLLRDLWITLKSLCETALGKIENNGIAYGRNGYMFEKRIGVDEEQLQKNIESLLEFKKKYAGESVSLMLVPTSDMILPDKLPPGLNNYNQLAAIEDIYKRAGEAGIKPVRISFDGLENKYIYYRTDHHWTTYGAYSGYLSYIEALRLSPVSLEDLGEGYGVPGFYGTYYSKAKLFSAIPDTITWYDVPVKAVTINGEEADGLYDMEKFDARDKYAAFLHGNNAVTVIESGRGKTHDRGEKSKLLLFKDSFGNSFAPFLAYSFDEITVVDLRYFNDVESLVTKGGFDDILVLYSFPSFAQETSIVNLKL